MIQHIVITKLKKRDLLLRQQEQLLFTPKAGAISCYSAVGGGGGWGHGVQQTDGCLLRRIWTSSIICASVRVLLVCVCVDYPCQCMHVCLLLHLAVQPVNRSVESVWAVLLCQILRSPLTHGLSGSLGTETAAMPLHNSSARPWTNPKEVWYHESQTRVTTGPRLAYSNFFFQSQILDPLRTSSLLMFSLFSSAKNPFCSLSNSVSMRFMRSIIRLWYTVT